MKANLFMAMMTSTHKKLKIYDGGVITNFQSKRMLKKQASCKCLSILVIDSVIREKKRSWKNVNMNNKR